MVEKILTLACLFGGFFWLRARARSLDLENRIGKAVVGVFVILPAALLGEKYLLDHHLFGIYSIHTDLILKIALLLATFTVIGFTFLKSEPSGPGGGPAGTESGGAARDLPREP